MSLFNGGHHLMPAPTLVELGNVVKDLRRVVLDVPSALRIGRRQCERLFAGVLPSEVAADFGQGVLGLQLIVIELDDFFEWVYPDR